MTTERRRWAVVVSKCVQVGPDDFEMRSQTRTVDKNTSVHEIMTWLKTLGLSEAELESVRFAGHTEAKND